MSLPPGLLPESAEPSAPRSTLILSAVVLLALLGIAGLLYRNQRLADDLNAAVKGLANEREKAKLKAASVPAEDPKAAPPVVAVPVAPAPTLPESAPPPPLAPKVRVLPEDPEYLSRGLQEFRQGRYDQAERQFFRAVPDSFLYLALTGLAQHNWREAMAFLARAMTSDPAWLRKVNPQDLFGSAAAYEAVLAALDEQVSKNPLDADLKTLSAYLRYHEKGAAYAKALLVEATAANPDHEAARRFLETLGP